MELTPPTTGCTTMDNRSQSNVFTMVQLQVGMEDLWQTVTLSASFQTSEPCIRENVTIGLCLPSYGSLGGCPSGDKNVYTYCPADKNGHAWDSTGKSEQKKCIYDGSASSGHGRCYGPTLEASGSAGWQQAFPQTVQLSGAWSSTSPILRDANATMASDTCFSNYGTLQVPKQSQASQIYMSCTGGTGCQNGVSCQTNQKAGTCKNKQCIQTSSWWRRM
ncbi:hypothetical protein WJX84_012154 [Apatococcus fuscideae]|uniref:Uncharacterized protein n=1 Tax=Apatococcus fuscideae TaxID=2026836 RepID=A0AAW1T0G2_9CHLO